MKFQTVKPENTKYTYSNEKGVLEFIEVIEDMLKSNLIEFGKTNEKPLAKTINILKSTTSSQEFYTNKALNSFATDMLTRAFSYYYWDTKSFQNTPLRSLQDFISLQVTNQLPFFISRIFASHLKKVRYDFYHTSQNKLFDIFGQILNKLPNDGWCSVDEIFYFCKSNNLRFDFESRHKTSSYYMECEFTQNDGEDYEAELHCDDYYYQILFFEPIVSALMFYLGALGILELKYDEPKSRYNIKAMDKEYISVWDSLEYVKLTDLGLFISGYTKSYKPKVETNKDSYIKFDEYKPIITINKTNTIISAKLELFADILDNSNMIKDGETRYILSYSKIFKDCKTYKALELKIEAFYKIFDTKPPEIFDKFFDDIKSKSNMLKKDLKQVVIELKNDMRLLNLFMTNKKLQSIIIKASGYRILVLKKDLPKLTKIVKDNGFFIEF